MALLTSSTAAGSAIHGAKARRLKTELSPIKSDTVEVTGGIGARRLTVEGSINAIVDSKADIVEISGDCQLTQSCVAAFLNPLQSFGVVTAASQGSRMVMRSIQMPAFALSSLTALISACR